VSASDRLPMLPVALRPLPDEGLSGLCLRNDEANGWPADTLARMVSHLSGGDIGFASPGQTILGTVFRLDALAEHLGCPLDEIEATTLMRPLRRLFGDDVDPRRLGSVGPLRVCPTCIAESRFIGRETILPLVRSCVEHQNLLAVECSRGHRLARSRPDAEPFRCATCGEPWSHIRPIQISGPYLLSQRRVVHAYRVVMERGGEDTVARARAVLGKNVALRWSGAWAAHRHIADYRLQPRYIYSLTSLVATLVVAEVPPERLFDEASPPRGPSFICRNRACPTFDRSDSMHSNGRRAETPESYCDACGSRFLGARTISSFDVGNGSSDLSPLSVYRARARLARFREAVAAACRLSIDAGDVLRIADVLERARVPRAAYLRASRLGIADTVHAWQRASPHPVRRWRSPAAEARVVSTKAGSGPGGDAVPR